MDPPSENDNTNHARIRRWNWFENGQEGFNSFEGKNSSACRWLLIVVANYTVATGLLIEWPTPNQLESALNDARIFGIQFPDDVLTMTNIYPIQAYNGVTLDNSIVNESGTLIDCNGGTIPLEHRILTPWEFMPNSTGDYDHHNLTFNPNQNDYVRRINNVYNQAQ